MASPWEISISKFGKLTEDRMADVCIVGGGLAGAWCAYYLSKAGRRVIMLEADRVGQGATGYTTAFLTHLIDTDLPDLVRAFGTRAAKLIWQSHAEAIDRIERVAKDERIDCEFMRVPLNSFAQSDSDIRLLEEEAELARKFGFNVELTRTLFKGFKNQGGMIVRNQAKYHPLKFFKGLLEAAIENGLEVFERTEVKTISKRGKWQVIETASGRTVKAEQVINATYDPLGNPKPTKFKKGMYETYVYSLRIKHGLIPEGMYEDQMNPYHYFRVDRDTARFDRLIIGGEDHRAELPKALERKSFKALMNYISDTFPKLTYTVNERWHGGILEPSDGLALIGQYGAGQYVACAFSGNGMTYSAITGPLMADLILGNKNPYIALYDPKRAMNTKALLIKARDYGEELVLGAGKNIFKRA